MAAACVIAIGLLVSLILALIAHVRQADKDMTARGQVQITKGRFSGYMKISQFNPSAWLSSIEVTNGSPWAVKDIEVTWIHYGMSGTELGRNTHTFYETIPAGKCGGFSVGNVGLPEQACKSKAFISDFDFVRPDTTAGPE
jgi:hypothetical protein